MIWDGGGSVLGSHRETDDTHLCPWKGHVWTQVGDAVCLQPTGSEWSGIGLDHHRCREHQSNSASRADAIDRECCKRNRQVEATTQPGKADAKRITESLFLTLGRNKRGVSDQQIRLSRCAEAVVDTNVRSWDGDSRDRCGHRIEFDTVYSVDFVLRGHQKVPVPAAGSIAECTGREAA